MSRKILKVTCVFCLGGLAFAVIGVFLWRDSLPVRLDYLVDNRSSRVIVAHESESLKVAVGLPSEKTNSDCRLVVAFADKRKTDPYELSVWAWQREPFKEINTRWVDLDHNAADKHVCCIGLNIPAAALQEEFVLNIQLTRRIFDSSKSYDTADGPAYDSVRFLLRGSPPETKGFFVPADIDIDEVDFSDARKELKKPDY
jgi:hypothetical protein